MGDWRAPKPSLRLQAVAVRRALPAAIVQHRAPQGDGRSVSARCSNLTPEEWTAVALSLRIALVATVVALPFGIADRLAAGAQGFLGQGAARRHRASAAGAAAGGHRLSAADLVRPPRPVRRVPRRSFGIVFSFRWTGAALACGVMAFPLLVRAIRLSFEAIDRRLEDAASTLGANGLWTLPHRHAAAGAARRHRRHGAVLRQGARRVRRHHHLRLQHPGRDADHLGRDLHATPRCRAATPPRSGWWWSPS